MLSVPEEQMKAITQVEIDPQVFNLVMAQGLLPSFARGGLPQQLDAALQRGHGKLSGERTIAFFKKNLA